jgi:hypothetical protein
MARDGWKKNVMFSRLKNSWLGKRQGHIELRNGPPAGIRFRSYPQIDTKIEVTRPNDRILAENKPFNSVT